MEYSGNGKREMGNGKWDLIPLPNPHPVPISRPPVLSS